MLSGSPLQSRFRVLVCNSVTAVRFELLTAFTELFLKPIAYPPAQVKQIGPAAASANDGYASRPLTILWRGMQCPTANGEL